MQVESDLKSQLLLRIQNTDMKKNRVNQVFSLFSLMNGEYRVSISAIQVDQQNYATNTQTISWCLCGVFFRIKMKMISFNNIIFIAHVCVSHWLTQQTRVDKPNGNLDAWCARGGRKTKVVILYYKLHKHDDHHYGDDKEKKWNIKCIIFIVVIYFCWMSAKLLTLFFSILLLCIERILRDDEIIPSIFKNRQIKFDLLNLIFIILMRTMKMMMQQITVYSFEREKNTKKAIKIVKRKKSVRAMLWYDDNILNAMCIDMAATRCIETRKKENGTQVKTSRKFEAHSF